MKDNESAAESLLVAIVDDDASMRNSTRRLIRSFGFRAEAYASAIDFLDSGRVKNTACLVLDVRMPDMDGLELQRHLAAFNCRIPIVFVTAHVNGDDQRRAIAGGAVDVLRKPVTEQALSNAIEAALRRDVYRGIGRGESPLND